jgi:hypothetical protein
MSDAGSIALQRRSLASEVRFSKADIRKHVWLGWPPPNRLRGEVDSCMLYLDGNDLEVFNLIETPRPAKTYQHS